MKSILVILLIVMGISAVDAQQNDWAGIQKIFGKSGAVQDGILKITFPRTDLKVMVGDIQVNPGLALTSWVAFMNNKSDGMDMADNAMAMGDLVLLDSEVGRVVSKIVREGLQVTAIHNHLVGETPAVKYVHFSGTGDAMELAEFIKSVIAVTGTPISLAPVAVATALPDWSEVESVLGKGKANGNLLQYGFPRAEKLSENDMPIPPYMGMATGVNFQISGKMAATAGDFVLLADEVNPVLKALTENGITVTAIHNHMLYDNPRLFMMHFWGTGDPGRLAQGIKSALDKTNYKR